MGVHESPRDRRNRRKEPQNGINLDEMFTSEASPRTNVESMPCFEHWRRISRTTVLGCPWIMPSASLKAAEVAGMNEGELDPSACPVEGTGRVSAVARESELTGA